MKAILILDIYDEEIPKEPVTAIRFSEGDHIYCNAKLKPMPERKKDTWEEWQDIAKWTSFGWNQCLDEITGEEE